MTTTEIHDSEFMAAVGFVYGQAASVKSLNALIAEISRTDIPVLLVGESGTGKEVYARLIHRLSRLGEGALKKVSCAAMDAGRLLSEVGDDFTSGSESQGAVTRTVFLDDVHELDAASQRALLSLLPDGEPKRYPGKTISRFISSTSRNLEKEIEAGRFRRELYFRINGVILRLPPLRGRKEDIATLLEFFLLKHSNGLNRNIPELSSDARELLYLALADLRATRVTVQVDEERWRVSSLKVASRAASRHAERELIQKALEGTHWNRKRAAQDLQISYKSLLYKIKQTGLEGKKTERE